MRARFGLGLPLFAILILVCLSADSAQTLLLNKIELPAGFEISLYADNLEDARSLTLGKNGTLFVSTRSEGKIYALPNATRANKAGEVITLARGLNMPNGVAFHN